MSYLIYCHTNKFNGKRYVGYTKQGIDKRWIGHLRAAENAAPLIFPRAIKKYGPDAWDHDIICDNVPTKADAEVLEIHYIEMLDTWGPNGYNMTPGGAGYSPKTKETKQKIRDTLKGHKISKTTRAKIRSTLTGRRPSKTALANLSAALKGKPKSAAAKAHLFKPCPAETKARIRASITKWWAERKRGAS